MCNPKGSKAQPFQGWGNVFRLTQGWLEIANPGLCSGIPLGFKTALFCDYLLTVREGTDEINQRKKRLDILCGLLEPLFLRKERVRSFSKEQRRILWNSTDCPRCSEGNHLL